jgi:2-hydroxychromene-2-carboxylate isomerase
VPSKWTYAQQDLARMARRLGLPFQLPPAFPQLWLLPPRAMLWIRAEHGEALAVAFARACYRTAFGAGVDINDAAVLAGLAAELSIDAGALAAGMASPAIKEALQRSNAAALERGVFGTPFVIADGEPYWGGDRLDLLDEALAQPRAA